MSHQVAVLATAALVVNVHRGAVLPVARFVVTALPCLALLFYPLVVRRDQGR